MIYLYLSIFLILVLITMSAPIAIGLGIMFSLLIKPDNKFITRRVSTIPLQIGVVILGSTIGLKSALGCWV